MMQRIDANILIPGAGEPAYDASLLHENGRITFAGPRAQLPEPAQAVEPVHVRTLMPGLWDCHTHFAGIRGRPSTDEMVLTPATTAVARSVKDAETVLRAGFTSVRDLGGYGCTLAAAIAEGTFTGPHVYSAHQVISQTAGHSDAHRLPHTWMKDPCRSGGMLHLADGVDECIRAVRLQLRAGAEVIKVCASGGVLSEVDNPIHQQFLEQELRVIVQEADRAERVVAAHCHGRAGILAAVRAGCRTVEHGTYLDEECAELLAERNVTLVPTRTIVEGMLLNEQALPPTWRSRFRAFADRHLEAIEQAHRTGVTIALGTDLGTSDRGHSLAWGANGSEFQHLVTAGMSVLEAIAAATAHGPATLGPRAPRSGTLAPDQDADLLALDDNPLEDLRILGDAGHVTHIWKAGNPVSPPLDYVRPDGGNPKDARTIGNQTLNSVL